MSPAVGSGHRYAAAESGRGLFLVAALADGGWGTAPHPPDGKTVWAEVAVSPAEPRD